MLKTKTQSENTNKTANSASILCVGVGWFPKTPGGLERYTYDLTLRLAANNLDKIELCGVGLPENEVNLPIKLTNLAEPNTSILQRLWQVRSKFKKTRQSAGNTQPDAINLHFALYSFPIIDLLPQDIPITFNFHGPWAAESQQEGKGIGQLSALLKKLFIEKQVYHRCQRFIVLSKAFGDILHQEYQIPWSKIHIIPGGVDTNRFQANLSRNAARAQLGWSTDHPTIFTSRRLVQRVGIDKLLTAISLIKPRIPDIMVAIAGRGYLQETLQKQASELELNNNVKFLGFLPDEQLPIAYQAADLCVMPTQSFEGFGLALVESLASGTPTICTPVGGMPEILQPFAPELITESTSPKAIAEKIAAVLLGEIPTPSREACRNYITENYDWDKIALLVRQVLL